MDIFCADLAHMRVLITPSPLTPVTPGYKRVAVLEYHPEFTITQPDFKKAKLESQPEGNLFPITSTYLSSHHFNAED